MKSTARAWQRGKGPAVCAPRSLGQYLVTYHSDGDVEVGCLVVSHDQVAAIYEESLRMKGSNP